MKIDQNQYHEAVQINALSGEAMFGLRSLLTPIFLSDSSDHEISDKLAKLGYCLKSQGGHQILHSWPTGAAICSLSFLLSALGTAD
jgi:hypothetical protein